MTDSVERRRKEQPDSVICAGGFVLRQREWSERGDECLGETCPHPLTCTTKHRNLQGGEQK